MIFLFFSALLFFCVFCGVGLLAARFSFVKVRPDNFFLHFFTGFSCVGIYASFVQLFFPLTFWTLLPVLAVGGAGLALSARNLRGRIASAPFLFALSLFFMFLVSYCISNKARIDAYDDFLYHASIVSWLNAYKAVPGIANLHFRLGMNSLYLQLAAALDVGVWDKRSSSVTVCLLYFSFLMYCLRDIYAAFRNPSPVRLRFAVCQSVFVLWLFFTESLEPYLNYDNPALMFMALVISEMLRYSGAGAGSASGGTRAAAGGAAEIALRAGGGADRGGGETALSRTPWETVFLFSAVSFAIKPMGAVAVFCVFAAALVSEAGQGGISVGSLCRLSLLPLCILALFVVRNVIQTGYLMFPMTSFKLDLPWTVSKQIVDINMNAIQNYSRTIALGYDYVPGRGFWYWFVPWLKWVLQEGNNILLPFVLAAGLIVALLTVAPKGGTGVASVPVKLAYYAFAIVNLLFCFITVPELRYDTVWIYGLLALALFFSPAVCSALAAAFRRAGGLLRPLADRLVQLWRSRAVCLVLAGIFLLAALLLLSPAVRTALIAFGSALARHELTAAHWEREFGRWGRVCFSLSLLCVLSAVFLTAAPGRKGLLHSAYALMVACVVCACAFRSRRILLPAAMHALPVEKRLVSEEQPFYVYVALEGDQCGDAPLPCTPQYCFSDRLRLFDIDNMGKGFYIKD